MSPLSKLALICAVVAWGASTASAKIVYRTDDPALIGSVKAAIQSLRSCKDCKHDTRLQTMLDYLESDQTPTFFIEKATLGDVDGIKYVSTECSVDGPKYRPGRRQNVILRLWPSEFDIFSKECPNGQDNPLGAGVFTPAAVLAHELGHCYYASQGRKITRNSVEEQWRAIAFENIYRRCTDVTPRRCSKRVDLSSNGVSWPNGGAQDHIDVFAPCQCSPSGENGTSNCNTVLGAGADGVCCDFNCYDQSRDVKNCGACGAQCEAGEACCGGECKDLTSDPKNCGSCGHWCPHSGAQMPCENSACTCQTACGGCSGYQCNGTCDYCNDPGTPFGQGDRCCWCGGDGCL
jgi:hypothetical protein